MRKVFTELELDPVCANTSDIIGVTAAAAITMAAKIIEIFIVVCRFIIIYTRTFYDLVNIIAAKYARNKNYAQI
jgi:hypothetical protein